MTAPHPPELTIPVHDLDAGGKEVRLALGKAWLKHALEGTEIAPGAGGELDVRLSKSGTDVVIHGELRGELVVACARCLEPARIAVREPISALAVPAAALREPGHTGHGEDAELEEDEADVIPYDGDTLVLDDLVRDELVLGVPMIPLCSESCPGITPSPDAGHDARDSHDGGSIDPRLRPLLALKKS
jgi:uncharacterized protein